MKSISTIKNMDLLRKCYQACFESVRIILSFFSYIISEKCAVFIHLSYRSSMPVPRICTQLKD